jgi:hypothetical protein
VVIALPPTYPNSAAALASNNEAPPIGEQTRLPDTGDDPLSLTPPHDGVPTGEPIANVNDDAAAGEAMAARRTTTRTCQRIMRCVVPVVVTAASKAVTSEGHGFGLYRYVAQWRGKKAHGT